MVEVVGQKPTGGANIELQKLAAKRGIDLSALSSGAAPAASDSPPVFVGRTPTREYRADGDVSRYRGGRKFKGVVQETKTLEEMNREFYNLTPQQLEQLQARFIAAGLVDAKNVRMGVHDDATYEQWAKLNERAARFYAAGKEFTPNDVLGMYERAASGLMTGAEQAPRVYDYTDPEAVAQTAEQAFRAALGRKPTEAELTKFTAFWRQTEEATQGQRFAAQDFQAGVTPNTSGQLTVDQFMEGLAAQESGGNYDARNARTGAAGKFQIMPNNWGPWAKEAGLGANAARTPENQDRVARFKMQQYYEQFGSWEAVAVAWYGGPGAAKAWLENPNAARFNKKHGGGKEPSINEYVQQAMGRMPAAGQSGAMAAGAAAPAANESDELWSRIQRMIADAPGKITPGPRTRDRATQEKLYADYVAGRGPKAAKPGTSKHGDGRANDLKYENDKVRQWVLANAHRYGLHFPIYDPKLARNRDESWHVELLGGYGGQDSTGASATAVQGVSLGAQAQKYAEQANPTEKRAYDIGQQFNSFVNILKGSVI